MIHPNREAWLECVAQAIRPRFDAVGAPLPSNIRIAIGFPSTGRRGQRIGECWDSTASADGTFEILIRPDIDEPLDVGAVLLHELIHAAVGIRNGHGPAFRRVALALGLAGPMRSTALGTDGRAWLEPIVSAAGPLPHARLAPGGLTTRPKPQPTRMIKCVCDTCGYTARTTRLWLDRSGAPHCPAHGAMVEAQ